MKTETFSRVISQATNDYQLTDHVDSPLKNP